MEHIPQPLNSDRERIVIPYLADQAPEYDGQGFANFPLRYGYSVSEGHNTPSDDHHHGGASYCASLQTWLWFGLLQEVLQTTVLQDAFIRLSANGKKVLQTESLLAYISAARKEHKRHDPWYRFQQLRSHEQQDEGSESAEEVRVRALLVFAWRCCEEVDRTTSRENEETGLVLLSIRVLIETLSGLFTNEDCLPTSSIQLDVCSLAPIRKRILSKSEWCRPRLEAICRSIKSRPYTSLAYLSSLRRHELPWQTHTLCEEIGACKAFDIDEATFEGLHVTPDCTCKNVSAPRDQMLAILREGGMPGVRYRIDNGVGRLEYFRISSASRYIAISHLWSSGLGNLRSNDLPKCQLQRLLKLLRKLKPFFGDIEFWLDIYCIPVVQEATLGGLESKEVAEMKSLKVKALAWMPATYSWANAVLVLDHELSHVSADAHAAEILASIHTSGWNSRYWTYQEGSLARKLAYALKNGAVVFASDLQKRVLATESDAPYSSRLWVPFEHYFYHRKNDPNVWHSGPCGFADITRSPTGERSIESFVGLWNHLVNRQTTKWRDALIIMGNLLGHRASQMSCMTSKDQMKALIKAQYTLPFQFLTIKAQRHGQGPDMYDRENAWVPQSPVGSEPMHQTLPLLVRENGLVLRFHHSHILTVVKFLSTSKIEGKKVVQLGSHAGHASMISIVPEILVEEDVDPEPLIELSEYLLILESLALRATFSEGIGRGCLLRVGNRSSNTMHVTYCCPTSWTLVQDQYSVSSTVDKSSMIKDAQTIDTEGQAIQFDCGQSKSPSLLPSSQLLAARIS